MMDPLFGTQLTDAMMANPWSFDPNQQTNRFSPYQNQAIPYPGTYNEGLQGGPVNAATGMPIQSYQAWKQANPAGVTLNATPAQPQATGLTPWQQYQQAVASGQPYTGPSVAPSAAMSVLQHGAKPSPQQLAALIGSQQGAGASGGPAAAPQGSGAPPNNWQAALNSLANPGNPVTQGATVPMVSGGQPAGGVNQAFLGQAGPGMNQRFLSALSAIQGRPQQ